MEKKFKPYISPLHKVMSLVLLLLAAWTLYTHIILPIIQNQLEPRIIFWIVLTIIIFSGAIYPFTVYYSLTNNSLKIHFLIVNKHINYKHIDLIKPLPGRKKWLGLIIFGPSVATKRIVLAQTGRLMRTSLIKNLVIIGRKDPKTKISLGYLLTPLDINAFISELKNRCPHAKKEV